MIVKTPVSPNPVTAPLQMEKPGQPLHFSKRARLQTCQHKCRKDAMRKSLLNLAMDDSSPLRSNRVAAVRKAFKKPRKEHLESLRDGRVVYIGSERVDGRDPPSRVPQCC